MTLPFFRLVCWSGCPTKNEPAEQDFFQFSERLLVATGSLSQHGRQAGALLPIFRGRQSGTHNGGFGLVALQRVQLKPHILETPYSSQPPLGDAMQQNPWDSSSQIPLETAFCRLLTNSGSSELLWASTPSRPLREA